MLSYETYCRLHSLAREGLNPTQLARQLNLHPRTVARWLNTPHYRQKTTPRRTSVLDPYKAQVVQWLEAHPLSAQQVLQRLQVLGYPGGYTTVKDYVRQVRPRRREAFLTLAFAPGEAAQVDWGSYGTIGVGQSRRRLHFFVMVLCYSRLMYVEFSLLQTMEHFLACHHNAFRYFGRVPNSIMVDNLKSAVLQRLTGEAPVLNPRYVDFANHYGFTIKPCAVGKGNEKGRVENGVGYVKKNFLNGLTLGDFAALASAARQWLDGVANQRLHAETRQRPLDRFAEEQGALLPLPSLPYDVGQIRSVRATKQFRVVLDSNRYSVPAEFASQKLTLKTYPDAVLVYHGERLIARHPRCYDRQRDFEQPDHVRELLQYRRRAREQQLLAQFLALSPQAEAYYRALEQKRLNPRHHVQKIVALSDIHGREAVDRALRDALAYHAYSSDYIANLLEMRRRGPQEPAGALHLTRREDLLDLTIPAPALHLYDNPPESNR
jgi:transposase